MKDDLLFIDLINDEVKIPFSGLVTNTNSFIKLETENGIINIYGANSNYKIYEYYNMNEVIAYSSNIIIDGRCSDIIPYLRIVDASI